MVIDSVLYHDMVEGQVKKHEIDKIERDVHLVTYLK